jgi:hypothetical protein
MALILMMWMVPVKHSDACAEADTAVTQGVRVRSQFSASSSSISFGCKYGFMYGLFWQGGWVDQLGESSGEASGITTFAWWGA